MMHLDGKITCDAEIGSVKRGWHDCGRKALYESESKPVWNGMLIILHWCEHHKERGKMEGRTNFKEIG